MPRNVYPRHTHLQPDHFGRRVILERVARVDDQVGALDDGGVIESGMIGDHDNAVGAARTSLRASSRNQLVVVQANAGDERIAVGDARAAALQQQNNIQRGRLAHVVDIALVSDAQDVNVRALERLANDR